MTVGREGILRVVENPLRPDLNYVRLLKSQGYDPNWRIWADLLPEDAKFGRVLELGAGCGNLAIPLARSGCDVTAIDLDPNMTAHLLSLDEPRLSVLTADMTSFKLREKFDLVVLKSVLLNIFDAKARAQVLRAAADHLNEGGLFAAEVYQSDWLVLGNCYQNEFQEIRCEEEIEQGLWRVESTYYEKDQIYNLQVFVHALSRISLSRLSAANGLFPSGEAIRTNPITEIVVFHAEKGGCNDLFRS